MMVQVQEKFQAAQETVIAKDQQSLFENIKEDQTAAESATVKGELRQYSSVGKMADQINNKENEVKKEAREL